MTITLIRFTQGFPPIETNKLVLKKTKLTFGDTGSSRIITKKRILKCFCTNFAQENYKSLLKQGLLMVVIRSPRESF